MSTPKGTRCIQVPLASGDAVHVYSAAGRIALQIRRSVRTADDLTAPSFKVAVALTADEALRVAAELLMAASILLKAKERECGQ